MHIQEAYLKEYLKSIYNIKKIIIQAFALFFILDYLDIYLLEIIFIYSIMAKVDEYVYLTLPKGTKPPAGYTVSKSLRDSVLYKKKVTVDMFSALDMKKMIKSNISKARGGKRTKKSKGSRKNRTRKH